jgi:ActR/RegA family two-component response regulator
MSIEASDYLYRPTTSSEIFAAMKRAAQREMPIAKETSTAKKPRSAV